MIFTGKYQDVFVALMFELNRETNILPLINNTGMRAISSEETQINYYMSFYAYLLNSGELKTKFQSEIFHQIILGSIAFHEFQNLETQDKLFFEEYLAKYPHFKGSILFIISQDAPDLFIKTYRYYKDIIYAEYGVDVISVESDISNNKQSIFDDKKAVRSSEIKSRKIDALREKNLTLNREISNLKKSNESYKKESNRYNMEIKRLSEENKELRVLSSQKLIEEIGVLEKELKSTIHQISRDHSFNWDRLIKKYFSNQYIVLVGGDVNKKIIRQYLSRFNCHIEFIDGFSKHFSNVEILSKSVINVVFTDQVSHSIYNKTKRYSDKSKFIHHHSSGLSSLETVMKQYILKKSK